MGSNSENGSLPRKRPMPGNQIYSGVPTIEYDEKIEEKPWQRVPGPLIIVLLGVYLLLAYLAQLVEDDMPRVIKDFDVPRDNSVTFSEEAAWRYLHAIQGVEPRVSGTKYHLQKTKDLKELVDSLAAQSTQRIRTDWQTTSGDYFLTLFANSHANAYQNVSNVIALLEGESGFLPNGTIGTSLLVNCHYDSVPYALGTSDDAIFCAVMMETLSKLSRRSQKLKHNVIFLFNGAEENTLQGSHGFLKHEWSKNIKSVINLDAAGANGKPIVFQVSDPRLLNIYKRVVYRPNGQSVGEFLFKTGVIPSDTDFRIWRDFGQFHGLDIAFVKWGHLYHTRNDNHNWVQTGVLQNAGNMLLALTTEVADTDALREQIDPSAAVYYDYLNWFLVTYSYGAAVAVDVLIFVYACLSVAYFVWLVGPRSSTLQELSFSVLSRVASVCAGLVVTFVFVPIMIGTTTQLRYLSHAWLVIPLYWMPYIITVVFVSQAFDAWRSKKNGLNRCIRTMQAQAATRLVMALILIVMTCVPSLVTVRYIITVPLFIMSTMALVSLTLVRYVRLQAWHHLLMEVLFSIPSTMFVASIALRFCALMLPVSGRGGADSPDYTIAMVNVGMAMLLCSTVSGLELLFSRKRLWLAAAPIALTCFILMFIPFNPYQDEGPSVQRHYWFHSEMISYNFNGAEIERHSGVVVTKHDAYTIASTIAALDDRGINVERRTDFSDDCQRYVHCNMPLYRVRFGADLPYSLFLYTGPPAPFVPDNSLTTTKTCQGNQCTFSFVMTAPAHNMLTFWPRPNVNLTSWSLDSPLEWSFIQEGRPVYIIIHSTPTYKDVFEPYLFNVSAIGQSSLQSEPAMDVALHSHLIHHPEQFTEEYRNLVNSMPKYFNIASFLSRRKNYVF